MNPDHGQIVLLPESCPAQLHLELPSLPLARQWLVMNEVLFDNTH